jgi:hypothetical protein
LQQRLDPFVIHHLGALDLSSWHETLGVRQDMALASFHLLGSVVTALLFTDWESTTPALG